MELFLRIFGNIVGQFLEIFVSRPNWLLQLFTAGKAVDNKMKMTSHVTASCLGFCIAGSPKFSSYVTELHQNWNVS